MISLQSLLSTQHKAPLASFAAKAALVDMDVEMDSEEQVYCVAAVTTKGTAQLFQFDGERRKTPMPPQATLKFVAQSKKKKALPVLGAKLDPRQPAASLHTARGLPVAPVFETVAYVDEETGAPIDQTLQREDAQNQTLLAVG